MLRSLHTPEKPGYQSKKKCLYSPWFVEDFTGPSILSCCDNTNYHLLDPSWCVCVCSSPTAFRNREWSVALVLFLRQQCNNGTVCNQDYFPTKNNLVPGQLWSYASYLMARAFVSTCVNLRVITLSHNIFVRIKSAALSVKLLTHSLRGPQAEGANTGGPHNETPRAMVSLGVRGRLRCCSQKQHKLERGWLLIHK